MRTIRFLASLAGLRLDQVAFWSKGDLPQSSNRYMSEERHGSYEGLLDLLQRPSHALNGHEAEIVSVVANALPRLVSPVQRHNAERVLASKRAQSRGMPYRPPSSRLSSRPQSASPGKNQRNMSAAPNRAVGALGLSPRMGRSPYDPPQDHLDRALIANENPPLKTSMLQAALTDEIEKAFKDPSRGAREPATKALLRETGVVVDNGAKREARSMVEGLRKEIATWQQRDDATRIVQMYWKACVEQGSSGKTVRARYRMKQRQLRSSAKPSATAAPPIHQQNLSSEPEPEKHAEPGKPPSSAQEAPNTPSSRRMASAVVTQEAAQTDTEIEYYPDRRALASACDQVSCCCETECCSCCSWAPH